MFVSDDSKGGARAKDAKDAKEKTGSRKGLSSSSSKTLCVLGDLRAKPSVLFRTRKEGARAKDAKDAKVKTGSRKWLFDNKPALSAVKKGLSQAAAGRLKSRGSFSRFANDTID